MNKATGVWPRYFYLAFDGEPDLSPGYVAMPGDEAVKPTLHPIYESQQEDSIRAHVEAELSSLKDRLESAGYPVSIRVDIEVLATTPVNQGTWATLMPQGITGVSVIACCRR